MTLTQLQQFRAVCQCGSISKAAEHLHISQPSISNSIKNLESEFEVNLFYRNNHRLYLTKEGTVLLEKILPILESVNSIPKIMLDLKECKNSFRLNVDPMIGATFFPDMYQSFQKDFPNMRVDISEYSFLNACKKIQGNKIDIAIALAYEPNKHSRDNQFHYLKLWESQLVFCTNQNHSLAKMKSLKTDTLSKEPLVLLNEDNPINITIHNYFKNVGIEPNILFRTEQIYMLKQFVTKGIAGSFLLKELVRGEPDIVSIPFNSFPFISIALLFKRNKYIYTDEEAFINFAKTYRPKH